MIVLEYAKGKVSRQNQCVVRDQIDDAPPDKYEGKAKQMGRAVFLLL